jgi:hypothetical protein
MPEDIKKEESENADEGKERFSSWGEFQEAVNIAKSMIDSRDITVKITSTLSVILKVNEAALEDRLKQKQASINSEIFNRILRSEIGNVTSAILLEEEDSYVRYALGGLKDDKQIQERRELTKQKIEHVRSIIYKTIEDKCSVKITSTRDFLEDISWEISERKYSSEEDIGPLRYATIRLEFKRSPAFRAGRFGLAPYFLLFAVSHEDPYFVTFDCDISQVDDLIDILKDAREKLKEQETKK